MKSKLFIGLLAAVLASASFIAISQEEASDIIDDSKALFKEVQLFADSITLISTDYVESIKIKDLVYGAIKGMMNTLDGYSQFLDPESFKEITEETKGQFGGVGIQIGVRDGVLTVISPIDDTPAFEAGVEAGDRIVKIDGELTRDMTLDDAVKKLRGDPGTDVSITVIREEAEELLDFKLTRAIIKLDSIKDARVIEGDIAYIRLVEFQQRTAKDLKSSIKELKDKGAKSLIIDVRNNPGGLLDAAVETADEFLEQGAMIVYTMGRDPEKKTEFLSKKKPDFGEMDIVVLVNKGSASASEILAGALKDNKRALLVGTTTFGKGSVQTVIPLEDKSALRLTTAAYYTPSGMNLMDKGIDPDITVERAKIVKTEEEKDKKKAEIFEKVEKDKKETEKDKKEREEKLKEERLKEDTQVQAAVNVLKGARIFKGYQLSETSPQTEKAE